MILECLGSSSSGNCYLLRAGDGVLVIECGIPMPEVKKTLKWKIGKITGCIVSHEHNDHAKYISDFMKCGIKVMALPDVFAAKGLSDCVFALPIKPKHGYRIGGFKVYALPVAHDVPCLGFIIEHEEMGKLLFVTDTMMLPYRIAGLDHIMLEVNYSDKILDENIERGIVPASMRERLLYSHMEIETAVGILEVNDLANVNEVVILHLSSNNSHTNEFRSRIMQSCGRPVYVADKGLKIDITKGGY